MAKFLNPLTGEMEDDGVPPAPVAQQPQPQPAQPQPQQSPAPSQPQVMETVDTTTTIGTSRQIASPEERRLMGEEGKLVEEQAALNEQARALGIQKAREEEAQAQEKARLTAEKQAKTEEITQKGQEDLNARLAEADRQYEALKKKSDIKDYWADKSTGDKVLAGLAIALGGIGAGMQGSQQNKALEIIQKNVEQDFERQKANFMQQKSVLDEARRGGEAGRQAIADQLNLLNLSKAAAYESLADRYAAMASKRGVPVTQLEADKVQLGLRQKALDSKQEFERSLRQTVTSNTVKNVNQELAKPVDTNPIAADLRKEWSSNPTTKTTNEMRGSVERIKSASDNAQGDLSLVYGYMKVLDPGSVVREGEFATAQNAAGIPTRVQNLYNKALRGERLSKEQRTLFKAEAQKLLKAQERVQGQVDSQFKRLATERGIKPEDVVMPFSVEQAETTPAMSEQDKQALEWANANPQDPRAAAIKQRLGQ